MSAPPVQVRSAIELMRAGLIEMDPPPPGQDLFDRVAHQHGIEAPRLKLLQDDGARAEWSRFYRRVWDVFPPWGWSPDFVQESARAFLPRVLAQMGMGHAIGWVSDDPFHCFVAGIPIPDPEDVRAWSWRWVVRHAPRPHLVPLSGASPYATGLVLRLHAGPAPLLFLDEVRHDWRCPELARVGTCLIDLGAWRWSCSNAKAAHRIARLCGLRRPVP